MSSKFNVNIKLSKEFIKMSKQDIQEAVDKWKIDLDEVIQKNLSGKILKRRTGHLAQKYVWLGGKFLSSKNEIKLSYKGNVPYGAIHEFGGVIKPKNVSWLTIPLKPALTPAGVLRKSARKWDDTFFFKSKKGNLILARRLGKDKIEPLFVLKKSVKIPKRQWFTKSVNEAIPMLEKRLKEA